MAKLRILKDNEPTLRKKSREVTEITKRTLTLLDDMLETMHKANGVGLAGPQVGVLRRIAVIEVEEGKVIELINPVIIEKQGSQTGYEGCLSVPGRTGIVTRPDYVRVKALDRNGEEKIYEGTGLLARCFCHEIAHLDGILYTDVADRMLTEEELKAYMESDEE
jgi:peptide deformylase